MIDWWWALVVWAVAWPVGYFRGWCRARDMYSPVLRRGRKRQF